MAQTYLLRTLLPCAAFYYQVKLPVASAGSEFPSRTSWVSKGRVTEATMVCVRNRKAKESTSQRRATHPATHSLYNPSLQNSENSIVNMGAEANGSCLCGAVNIHVAGDPLEVRLCYCTDCRKVSGGTNSVNWCVQSGQVSIQTAAGVSLSSVAVKADSGACMTGFFCPKCGTTLYRQSTAFRGLLFVKAGVFDDHVLDARRPQVEAYVVHRPVWMCALAGADQKHEG
ncbi:hypothetical protein MCOR31_010660 [Pyricularia oryzae]|nr:hypothetical protein MCOR30_011098 [Pyricularia oryzae]KAI6320151.1 hypothetical protein MCOR34_003067 [Pyricularia oryzae]KAI6356594.1 hypothetical protein MCOR31_010660 [Pyricularia oryzae]KAI6441992.1 hypothetical protein MCOR22_006167 [Pyricularia oryzae]KAI6497906.1 hypothetical protein MCOR13_006658 [Pyricularia oryzae]